MSLNSSIYSRPLQEAAQESKGTMQNLSQSLTSGRLIVCAKPNAGRSKRRRRNADASRGTLETIEAARKRPKSSASPIVWGQAFAWLAAISCLMANMQQTKAQQLPTVIVRGFLNYRTTVDNTVLLFTPDAGQHNTQQSTSTPAANSAPPGLQATATLAPGQQPSASQALKSSLVYMETLAHAPQVEPTSVLAQNPLQTTHLDSNSFRQQPQQQPPAVVVQPIAAAPSDSQAAQADEWRPIQATPPLRLAHMHSTRPSSSPSQEARQESASEPMPSVQADDVTSNPADRPKRPALGFSGQGLRPRVPGTAGATSPSLQSRPKLTGGSPSPNSINGIRRPGLGSSPSQTTSSSQSQVSDAAALANASSAFQNRLASANTRLKNRFKFRQSSASNSSGPAAAAAAAAAAALKPQNSLAAPENLLDVASSIERPTPAAQSSAPAPSASRSPAGPPPAGQLASSRPAVGSDEVSQVTRAPSIEPDTGPNGSPMDSVVATSPNSEPEAAVSLEPISTEQQAGTAALSRAGEQRPHSDQDPTASEAKVLRGELQHGSLSNGPPLNLEALFQSDQASGSPSGQAATEQAPTHVARPSQLKPTKPQSNNSKLNGWLGQHHNKFVPRHPAKETSAESSGNLSQQLAANLQQMAPTPVGQLAPASWSSSSSSSSSSASGNNSATSQDGGAPTQADSSNANSTTFSSHSKQEPQEPKEQVALQTITKTFSTTLATQRTRLVPLQVKSSTGIFTITEDYVMTKVMTAYQTMPAGGEFILADQQLSTRGPYEVFETPAQQASEFKSQQAEAQQAAPAAPAPIETQEQPISLDTSPKGANNWLHDFSKLDSPGSLHDQLHSQQQSNLLSSMLEQQAREANLAGFPLVSSANGEPLDQLASQLDPAALLAEGQINIPDLNNPLVLAAAIQNPQLAAVILAAQQLKLKRQQQKSSANGLNNLQPHQLQPSFSTSFSTNVRPSTYTVRDTMYTTRLVSFRDGRTVRTRTVSEPGQVIEQVLTKIVSETIPITLSIKPTAALLGAGANQLATGLPAQSSAQANSNQATINNALFATQLANILARRQQQLQTSFQNPALVNLGVGGQPASSTTPQQLLALQQLFSQQQQRQQSQASGSQQPQPQQQFQPNFQQLLQSMQAPSSSANNNNNNNNNSPNQQQPATSPQTPVQSSSPDQLEGQRPTPSLQQPPKSTVSSPPAMPANVLGNEGPITTTLTSLQTRTYTVHNAFKTIFRTITSTVLIPTVLSGRSTQLANIG